MGVPVVVLAGDSHVSRVGVSLLNAVGIQDECLARSGEEFISKAINLAHNRPLLESLQKGLRERMETSPLMDGLDFTREFERTLERMIAHKSEGNE